MSKMSNLERKRSFIGLLAGLLVLALAACQNAERSHEQSSEAAAKAQAGGEERFATDASADSEDSEGFFARVGGFFDSTEEMTVPSGTLVTVRFLDTLSSHASQPGDRFTTEVAGDVTLDGTIVVPAGSRIHGHVTEAAPAKIGGRSRLSLDFDELELPSGEATALDAEFSQRGKSEKLKDAAIIAGGTLGGVILGEAVDEGEGGVIGGIVGGVAGALGAKETKGKPVVLPSGTELTLQLTAPVKVEVST